MTGHNDHNVEVEKDGVRLGWNVLAIIASLGLGLYVSSIVSPLEDALKRINQVLSEELEDQKEFQIEQSRTNKDLREHVIRMDERLKFIEGNAKRDSHWKAYENEAGAKK